MTRGPSQVPRVLPSRLNLAEISIQSSRFSALKRETIVLKQNSNQLPLL